MFSYKFIDPLMKTKKDVGRLPSETAVSICSMKRLFLKALTKFAETTCAVFSFYINFQATFFSEDF